MARPGSPWSDWSSSDKSAALAGKGRVEHVNTVQKRQHFRGILNKIKLGGALLLCPVALWLIAEPVSAQVKLDCEDANKTLELIAYPPGESNSVKCTLTNQDNKNTIPFSISLEEFCHEELDVTINPNVNFLAANQSIQIEIFFLDKAGGSQAGDVLDCQIQAQSSDNSSIDTVSLKIQLIDFIAVNGIGIRPDINLAVVVNPPGLTSPVTYTVESSLKRKEIKLRWRIQCPSTVQVSSAEAFEEFTLKPKKSVKKIVKFLDNSGGAGIGDSVNCELLVQLIEADGFVFDAIPEIGFSIYLLITPGIYVVGPLEGVNLPVFCPSQAPSCDVPVLVVNNPPSISTVGTFEYVYTTSISFDITPTIDCPAGVNAFLESIEGNKAVKFRAEPPVYGEKSRRTRVQFRFDDERGGLDGRPDNNSTSCIIGGIIVIGQGETEKSASFSGRSANLQVLTFESRKGLPISQLRNMRLAALAIRRASTFDEQRDLCQKLLSDLARPKEEAVQTPLRTLLDLIPLSEAFGLLSTARKEQIAYHLEKIQKICLQLDLKLNRKKIREILIHITAATVALFENGRYLRDFYSRRISNQSIPSYRLDTLRHQVELYDLTGRRWFAGSSEPGLINMAALGQQQNLAAGVYLIRISLYDGHTVLRTYLEKLIVWPREIQP